MKRKLVPILVGLALLIVFVLLKLNSVEFSDKLQQSFDNFLYDSSLKLELTEEPVHEEGYFPPVIVDIDEKSIQDVGRWPWPRDKVAKLIENIRALGAYAIAFDVLFSESVLNPIDEVLAKATGDHALEPKSQSILESMKPQFDADGLLAKAIQNDVAMGFLLHDETDRESLGALPPPLAPLENPDATDLFVLKRFHGNLPILQKAATNGGFITVIPDEDGVIRKAPLILGLNNGAYPSLALEAVRVANTFERKEIKLKWGEINGERVLDGIALGKKFIATDTDGRVFIPFSGTSPKFIHVSAAHVLHGKEKPDSLKKTIVFVGSSALSLGDLHPTPVNPVFPGVDMHGYMTEGIQTGQFLRIPYFAPLLELGLLVLVGVLLALLLPFLNALWMVLAGVLTLLAMIALYAGVLHFGSMLISVTLPIGLIVSELGFNLVYGMLFEFRRRSQLKNLFGQYVPKEIVERMSEHPELYNMDGSSEVLTVLFADVVHFTTVSETLTPKQIRQMLNLYFTPMTRIILETQGTIDKYVGDMIMAFWGAPIADAKHATHALNAAIEMQKEVERLGLEFAQKGLPVLHVGVGLNTGPMSVGDMGSEYRRAYTVLGDTVNTGSRFEGLTRFYGIKIAVGPETRAGQEEHIFRLIDRVKVKGKAKAVELFELVTYKKDLTPDLIAELDAHHKAMDLYFAKEFKKATGAFNELITRGGNPVMYSLFLDRIKSFETNPPPGDWDGSTEWTQK